MRPSCFDPELSKPNYLVLVDRGDTAQQMGARVVKRNARKSTAVLGGNHSLSSFTQTFKTRWHKEPQLR
jgi:hypothetical protein